MPEKTLYNLRIYGRFKAAAILLTEASYRCFLRSILKTIRSKRCAHYEENQQKPIKADFVRGESALLCGQEDERGQSLKFVNLSPKLLVLIFAEKIQNEAQRAPVKPWLSTA
ncbi:hypothetical protein CHS0354_000931 [Potamilus streckersoni]|uniref:Uncharacterized protein n=1 Tax=Potamilus streckersoni TaxID=2493646 RepID=A0AAE0W0Z1_9BIVA|nr:hypothetical protein CHS0354_000931 [Potamilus streckersoni]